MFRKDFCEIELLKQRIASGFKWPNVIINTKTSSEHRSHIKGTLSIFSSNEGAGYYTSGEKTVRVGEDTFFISNEAQEYGIDIEEKTETFNIHFSTDMLRMLQPCLVNKNDKLLDTPDKIAPDTSLYNKLYWKDQRFLTARHALMAKAVEGELEDLFTEEVLSSLLEHLYTQQVNAQVNISSLSVTKYATRAEIAKRMNIVCEYIYEQYMFNISLDELAKVACMSKYHFLRLFKEMYRCTPYQYIISVRLDKAKQLLRYTSMQVSEISFAIGYEDVSSFCRGFKKMYKEWPQAYRLLVQK